jgi:hypothetical protein
MGTRIPSCGIRISSCPIGVPDTQLLDGAIPQSLGFSKLLLFMVVGFT